MQTMKACTPHATQNLLVPHTWMSQWNSNYTSPSLWGILALPWLCWITSAMELYHKSRLIFKWPKCIHSMAANISCGMYLIKTLIKCKRRYMFPICEVGNERVMLWLNNAMFKSLSLVKFIQSSSPGVYLKGKIRDSGAISGRSSAAKTKKE